MHFHVYKFSCKHENKLKSLGFMTLWNYFWSLTVQSGVEQGSHRFEKYLNLEGFIEKSLKIKSALKSTGKSLKSLEKTLNSTIFCRT